MRWRRGKGGHPDNRQEAVQRDKWPHSLRRTVAHRRSSLQSPHAPQPLPFLSGASDPRPPTSGFVYKELIPKGGTAPFGIITPTNTSDRSVCRFGDMYKSARCPWYHPTASGTTQQPQGDAGSDMLPPRHRTPAAVSVPAEKERARNWEGASNKATGHRAASHTAVRRAPTGHTTIHKGTMRCEHCSNHQMRRTPSEPSANTPPPLSLQGAHILHKGGSCAPRAGRCPPRGWQQGRDQPTAHGTVHVVRRCEILVREGRRVGQGAQ